MGISLAVWGIFTGWVIMPRGKFFNAAIITHIAYVLAIITGVGIVHFFDCTRQSLLFLIGMIGQYMVYLLAMGCKYVFKKVFKPRGM